MSLRATLLASALIAAASTQVLAQEPQVPVPTNPYPANPVATDGSSLAGALYGRRDRGFSSDLNAVVDGRVGPLARRVR